MFLNATRESLEILLDDINYDFSQVILLLGKS